MAMERTLNGLGIACLIVAALCFVWAFVEDWRDGTRGFFWGGHWRGVDECSPRSHALWRVLNKQVGPVSCTRKRRLPAAVGGDVLIGFLAV